MALVFGISFLPVTLVKTVNNSTLSIKLDCTGQWAGKVKRRREQLSEGGKLYAGSLFISRLGVLLKP
jgi:hypothetical protein